MTTKQIEEALAKQTKENNKLKSYVTKLAKALVNKTEVKLPSWSKEEEE
jgi:hypothetical protein